MNPYSNLLKKVKALLKEDDNLTKSQCEMFQWQQLIKIGEFTFTVGKGGVNTIFYSKSSDERDVCYPEEIINLLDTLAKGKVFVYVALNKSKEVLGYSVMEDQAKNFKGAKYLAAVSFTGKQTVVKRKIVGLDGNKTWQ